MNYWYVCGKDKYELVISTSSGDRSLLLSVFSKVFGPYKSERTANEKLVELTNAKESAEEKNT